MWSRMYAEHAITCSARFAIQRSIPWMWLCGCLSTHPWWRPYSVAWIVIASGASKRLARWSPATATSQSCPCTTSKSKRSPSSTPAASMSVFMCSTQAMNSPSSAGRRGSQHPVQVHALDDLLGRRLLAAAREDVHVDALADEVLRHLAHVPREPALDQRRVLPGQDQDPHNDDLGQVAAPGGRRLQQGRQIQAGREAAQALVEAPATVAAASGPIAWRGSLPCRARTTEIASREAGCVAAHARGRDSRPPARASA